MCVRFPPKRCYSITTQAGHLQRRRDELLLRFSVRKRLDDCPVLDAPRRLPAQPVASSAPVPRLT